MFVGLFTKIPNPAKPEPKKTEPESDLKPKMLLAWTR
jgi:hypothetical protein